MIDIHDSDCATHNMPAYPNGPCDCTVATMEDIEKVARALCKLDERDPDDAITGDNFPTEPYPRWKNYKLQAEVALAAMSRVEPMLAEGVEPANHLAAARVFLNEAVKILAQTATTGANHNYISRAETNIDAAQGAISRAISRVAPVVDDAKRTEFRNWVFDALQTVNDGNCIMGPLADEIAKVAAAMARIAPVVDDAMVERAALAWTARQASTQSTFKAHFQYVLQAALSQPHDTQGLYDALNGIRNDLGYAEWGSPENAEELLRELIEKWHPKACAALAEYGRRRG